MQVFKLDSEQYADLLSERGVRILDTLDYGHGMTVKVIDGGKSYGDCLGISSLGDMHLVIQTNLDDEFGSMHNQARNLQ